MSDVLRVKATINVPIAATIGIELGESDENATEQLQAWFKQLDRQGWDELLLLADGEATLTVESFEEV